MSRLSQPLIVLLLALLPLTAALTHPQPARAQESAPPRVLMVTATAGFYHSSITTAQDLLRRWAAEGALRLTLLPDLPSLAQLNEDTLAVQDVVFFANTTGELPLDDSQKQALLSFVAGRCPGRCPGRSRAVHNAPPWTSPPSSRPPGTSASPEARRQRRRTGWS